MRKQQFSIDVKPVINIEDIPAGLIINWDQTGINYVPTNSWTMEKEGQEQVEIVVGDN